MQYEVETPLPQVESQFVKSFHSLRFSETSAVRPRTTWRVCRYWP